MTKAEQITEYLKCKNDFFYFCEKYILIEIAGGDQNFKLYDKQKEFVKLILDQKFVIALKSRQVGISTTLQAFCAWLVTFYENLTIGIISKDLGAATKFSRFIRSMVEKLPEWMNPGFAKYTEMTFITKKTRSEVISAGVNPQEPTRTFRGTVLSFLIIDEGAFVPRISTAWESFAPALSTAHKHARTAGVPYGTVIVSTPNKTTGVGQFYFEQWSMANQAMLDPGESNTLFKPIIIHWKDIKELADDPLWYKNTCALFNNDSRRIRQELELIFLPTSGSFFDEKTCSELQENTKDIIPKNILKLFNGEVWIFEDPKPNCHYIIGIDTASEYGNDKSGITIWDYETLDQIWEYQGKLPVTDFEKVVDYACMQYPGTIVVERNSYGNQIAEHLDRGNFSVSLYKQHIGEQIKTGLGTDIKTRPLMIDALYSYVSQYPQMVKSKRLALELIGLVTKKNGKVEADDNSNDDLAITLSFCAYVRKYDPPLMIELDKRSTSNVLDDIISMNYDHIQHTTKESDNNLGEVNARILKEIKETMVESKETYFNILDFYRG